jgi:hypothetical protein
MEIAEADEDWSRIQLSAGQRSRRMSWRTCRPMNYYVVYFMRKTSGCLTLHRCLFRCACSRERVDGILRSLGEAESRDVLAEQGVVEVKCEFCNRAWQYDAVDIGALFSGATDAGSTRAYSGNTASPARPGTCVDNSFRPSTASSSQNHADPALEVCARSFDFQVFGLGRTAAQSAPSVGVICEGAWRK